MDKYKYMVWLETPTTTSAISQKRLNILLRNFLRLLAVCINDPKFIKFCYLPYSNDKHQNTLVVGQLVSPNVFSECQYLKLYTVAWRRGWRGIVSLRRLAGVGRGPQWLSTAVEAWLIDRAWRRHDCSTLLDVHAGWLSCVSKRV